MWTKRQSGETADTLRLERSTFGHAGSNPAFGTMKIRIKMHQMPGDICKREKIRLLESPNSDESKRSKTLKNLYRMRERAAFKEQTRVEIERE